MSRLPAYFQTQSTTVLDELANYELEPNTVSTGTTNIAQSEDDTITGAFGDLNDDNLPEFFKSSMSLAMTEDDRLNILATIEAATPPRARPSHSSAPLAPPGLTTATGGERQVNAPVMSLAELRAKQQLEQREAQRSSAVTSAPYFSPPPQQSKEVASPLVMNNSDAYFSAKAAQKVEQPQKPISYAAALGPVDVSATVNTTPPVPPGISPANSSNVPASTDGPPPHLVDLPSAGRSLFAGSAAPNANINSVAPLTYTPLFNKQHPLLFDEGKGFSTTSATGTSDAARITVLRSQGKQLFATNDSNISTGEKVDEIKSPTTPMTEGDMSSHFKQRTSMPRGKCMTPSDVRFVVNRTLQPMESTDPYSDDFYFLLLSIKKNAAAREAAMRNQQEMPPMIYVPLPTWRETKERIKLQMEATKRAVQLKSREWEQKEQVLGHNERIDVHRPKAKLTMPDLNDLEFDLNDDEDFGELNNPFSSRLWTMRLAVQRGYEALYTVQELQHLLTSPQVAANSATIAEIQREIEHAITLLSQSVGIRTAHSSNTGGSSHTVLGTAGDFSLDGGHVGAILQTNIGKKLISRSLKLLRPPHRWALLPVILAKTLLSTNVSSTDNTTAVESQQIEQKLLKTIIEFLQYSYQFQIEQQRQAEQQQAAVGLATPMVSGNMRDPPAAVAEFTDVLLANLRQCIKSVMITQMEKSRLVQALISERTRAEVMHMIVQIGDKVCMTASANLAEEWKQTREAFVAMLDH